MKTSGLIRDWIIALIFCSSVFFIYQWASQRHFNSAAITPHQFTELISRNNNVLIVDLRESNEVQRLPLSMPHVHLPYLWLRKWNTLPGITPGVLYIFVCSDGNRARMISTLLYEKGYQTFYLRDGLWSITPPIEKSVNGIK